MRLKGRRPSPAMIVAGAALIIALAGTAMAAPTAIKSILNKQEKKQVKSIAANQVNKLAPGLSVANAANATNATNANNATNATNATNADNAAALGGQPLANIVRARSVNGAVCDPQDGTLITCATLDMTLPHEGRVLLIGTAGQYAFTNSQASGNCLFRVDNVNSGGSVTVGNQYAPALFGVTNRGLANGFATTIVTGQLSATLHTFVLACNQLTGDVEFEDPQIAVALVGD